MAGHSDHDPHSDEQPVRRSGADQLSLRLDAELPRLPDNLRPMLARPLPEPFDSADHLFEPMWGGARALALIGPSADPGGGEVVLVAENGAAGPAPVDLAGIAARVAARSAVLDGEIVVVDADGRLDRAALGERLHGQPGRPMSYLAFDLLHLDGRDLLRLPLERRRRLLKQVLRPGDEVVAVPAIAGDGRALFAAVAAQGLLGIRARQRTSPYLPGVRSRLWRTIEVGAGSAEGGGAEGLLTAGRAAAGAAGGGAEVGDAGLASLRDEPPWPGGRHGPVLALISRLPLEFEDEAKPGGGRGGPGGGPGGGPEVEPGGSTG
jgi:ATP dependent DNA ligase domain